MNQHVDASDAKNITSYITPEAVSKMNAIKLYFICH